jgi:ribosomal protein S18 acetylase RimI-like enzyme
MSGAVVRPLEARDRAGVASILSAVGVFSPDEVETALELIDEWLDQGESSGYLTYVLAEPASNGGTELVRGYVCFGPTPLTEGTYDLYWVAVDPGAQGHGYGQQLLAFAEAEVQRRSGRLLLIETASHDVYSATVRFYERAGYQLVSRIANFYRPGDDKLTFAKAFSVSASPRPNTIPAH